MSTRTINPDLTRTKPEYTAFVETRKSETVIGIRLEESTGIVHLIHYQQLGRITYTPSLNLITIPTEDTIVCLVGKNMQGVVDTIQHKKLKAVVALPTGKPLPSEEEAVILNISFHEIDSEKDLTEEITELLQAKGINLMDL